MDSGHGSQSIHNNTLVLNYVLVVFNIVSNVQYDCQADLYCDNADFVLPRYRGEEEGAGEEAELQHQDVRGSAHHCERSVRATGHNLTDLYAIIFINIFIFFKQDWNN